MEGKNNGGAVHGFKVFNEDWTCSPNGNIKQYTCPGKFEENVDLKACESGMHFCENAADCFNYHDFDSGNKVAEVIAYGKVVKEGDKSCTDKLEIVREIPWEEVLRIVNTGNNCTGYGNTGGDNTGNRNTGDGNTGNHNTGNRNTGNRNTGDGNTGNRNTGNRNTGDGNTGNHNTGNRNTGNRNTGYRNTGDWNTGDWNRSSHNTGCFATEEHKIKMFNEESDWTYRDWLTSKARALLNHIPKGIVEWVSKEGMTEQEKTDNPGYATAGGFLRVVDEAGCAQEWWDGLREYEKDIIRKLPNFDPEIFRECTGINVESTTATEESGKEK